MLAPVKLPLIHVDDFDLIRPRMVWGQRYAVREKERGDCGEEMIVKS